MPRTEDPALTPLGDTYRDRTALVTGGFGFMGSNLVPRLKSMGARVRILGRSWPSSMTTIAGCDDVSYFKGDIRDEPVVEEAVRGCDFIFHLAGKSGASTSNHSPLEDLDVNCRGLLLLLDDARRLAPEAVIVFPSSRLVYASNLPSPVSEHAEKAPLSVYGAHKLTAENYMRIYHREHAMNTISLRITNPYGPYQRPEQRNYGVINQFIYRAVKGEPITLFGQGEQLRDYVHVNDVVEALLEAAASRAAIGQTFNVGSGTATSLAELAGLIVSECGSGSVEHIPWPASEARVETGDFCADISLINRTVGWSPRISLRDGVREVVDHLRRSPHLRA
jgi:UDP-glucose 4-epimerase